MSFSFPFVNRSKNPSSNHSLNKQGSRVVGDLRTGSLMNAPTKMLLPVVGLLRSLQFVVVSNWNHVRKGRRFLFVPWLLILVVDWDNKLEIVYEASLYSTVGLAAHSIFFHLGIPFLCKIGTRPVQVFSGSWLTVLWIYFGLKSIPADFWELMS